MLIATRAVRSSGRQRADHSGHHRQVTFFVPNANATVGDTLHKEGTRNCARSSGPSLCFRTVASLERRNADLALDPGT